MLPTCIRLRIGLGFALNMVALGAVSWGQQPNQPASAPPDSGQQSPSEPEPQPPAEAEQPAAVVIDLGGQAHWAVAGTSPLAAEGWTAMAVGDQLGPGTLIRTGLRSHVSLQFGQTTTVSVRSASFASIDQFFRTATTERVRVGLGYGTVRGGSTEGPMESDVTVDTPVATLAKRGTEGWQIWVEAGTGRFAVSLAEFGLVEAIKKLSSDRTQSRSVRPGEYATESNIARMWIEQDIFDRTIWLYEPAGLTATESDFAVENSRGLASLAPGSGAEARNDSQRSSGAFARQQTALRSQGRLPGGFTVAGPIERPEGNFGTAASFKRTAIRK